MAEMTKAQAIDVLAMMINAIEEKGKHHTDDAETYASVMLTAQVLKIARESLQDGWDAAAHYNEGYYDAVNSKCWVRTADRFPTKADTNSDLDVIAVYDDREEKEQYVITKYWKYVRESPEQYPYWMPFPKPPEGGV